ADVEEIRGYFLTSENEPRRRLSALTPKDSFPSGHAHERHREAVTALAPAVARAHRQWIREKDFYAVREIYSLYRQAAARFQELKRARAGLDFTDVLLEAVSLLEKRGEFSQSRFRLESRYHHLLIDEFQDTNEYQWRLIRALVDSWGEGSGLVQEAILAGQSGGEGRIREPSLFLVGDRKQSIYGWRDARVEVMEKAARHLLGIRIGGGKKLTLRHSFRAAGPILSFLNDLFSEVPRARGDLEWSFQFRASDHFPTPRIGPASAEPSVAIAAGRSLGEVSAAVADEIVRLLQEERLRPRDIAILFRSRSSYRAYEEALSARGVPAYVYRGLGFFDSPEVLDIQALVRFLAEPASRLRAAELARSRFVAVTDAALMRMTWTAGSRRMRPLSALARWLQRGSVDVDLPLSEGDREAVSRAARLIPSFLPLVDRIPAFELLERIVQESDYARWFVHDRQAWENLKKVMEMVRRAENRGSLTMSRLADFLAAAATDDESRAVLEAVDAVNLMTIHAAKGLEFESVFLVNMHQKRREDTSLPRVRELADGGVEVTALGAFETGVVPEAGIPNCPNRVEEEEKRLLYVALTRARRKLALSAVVVDDFEQERSLLGLLPASFQSVLKDALEASTETRTIEWRGHPLGILRPAEGRRFQSSSQEPRHLLRLEPLSPDAYEPLAPAQEEGSSSGVPLSVELPASGEIRRRVPFALARGTTVHHGVIDLLVLEPGRATVIERLRAPATDEDRSRMALCLEAVAAVAPEKEVTGFFLLEGASPEFIRSRPADSQMRLF
ncbi:MAG TPA: 3'-5' exonuclease, partial [Vicinamibacteria bacterium]